MLSRIKQLIATLIAPPFCVLCKKFLDYRDPLCAACAETIQPIISAVLCVRGYHVTVFALSGYEGIVKQLILAKHNHSRLAARQLGQLMATHMLGIHTVMDSVDYIIPVPLHWTRYAQRGFNQAEVIAEELAICFQKQVSCGVLRARKTVYQASLARDERQKNVQEVFKVMQAAQETYHNKHLLVVDDLMTTGATLKAFLGALAVCRPASITVLVAARVV